MVVLRGKGEFVAVMVRRFAVVVEIGLTDVVYGGALVEKGIM